MVFMPILNWVDHSLTHSLPDKCHTIFYNIFCDMWLSHTDPVQLVYVIKTCLWVLITITAEMVFSLFIFTEINRLLHSKVTQLHIQASLWHWSLWWMLNYNDTGCPVTLESMSRLHLVSLCKLDFELVSQFEIVN